jgi:N,N'-diacetyllegionaminate synthase
MVTASPADPYIVAEVGGNHGGDVERAKEYVDRAADAGVDAVKFQLFQAEYLLEEDVPLLPGAGTDHDTQFDRYKELELTTAEWEELARRCDDRGVEFAASAFDEEMATLAADLSPFIKIASGDMTHLPLIRDVLSLGADIVMSTGYATMDEIETVVAEIPADRLTLLHCVGAYPTPPEQANIQLVSHLQSKFDVPVGYSDHTVGTAAAKAAVARGATIVEKHFTLDKSKDTGDHGLSATPEEMAEIVAETATIAEMIGTSDRTTIIGGERNRLGRMRRSLATARKMQAGERLTEDDLVALRPDRGV